MNTPINQHNAEIQSNKKIWDEKSLLRKIYTNFYQEILKYINRNISGEVVEIGSGIGNFKSVYPGAVATDLFLNPWIDRVESAYKFSSSDSSISNLVLFDVFHHIEYPGLALAEFKRILQPSGRVIIFEPYISLFGLFVYGIFHHEPLALFQKINWKNTHSTPLDQKYYAAEGNATRVFGTFSGFKSEINANWRIIEHKKYSALSYVLSGGFSRPALYSEKQLPLLRKIERILDVFPLLFATRTLVVLEKK